jgi:hypothetical protein
MHFVDEIPDHKMRALLGNRKPHPLDHFNPRYSPTAFFIDGIKRIQLKALARENHQGVSGLLTEAISE